ncbi:hypothetical protein V9T40_007076 [Parthenolecanium corni]|uniref:Cathepsin L n=1 Tax=Parthenolecanium corni TaxID=536013 RepID=A0AAN9TVT4_9HEMI
MKILILLALVAATQAVSFIDLVREEWSIFKLHYSKKYDNNVEDGFRMKIYMDNKHKIYEHNKLYEQGLVSFKMEMNHFGDMLHHEFIRTMNGYRRNLNRSRVSGEDDGSFFMVPYNVTVPDVVDWRQSGAVTPVKDQGYFCESSWAFSTTGSLEGQHFRKTGKLVSLSEQNLIDCSQNFGNNGCDGGTMDRSFRYIKANNGIDTEISYPYEGKDDICRYNPATSRATVTGFVEIPEGDEEKLKIAVATVGPVSVAIDASQESFPLYSSGVYYEKRCSPTEVDHGVLVVGYGTENGQDYWLVKNSWGLDWGDAGYIKMARNKNNNCGIASDASYPLV